MSIFNSRKDYELMMRLNSEMSKLYFQDIDFWLRRASSSFDGFYSEDVNFPFHTEPTYTVPAYVSVQDFGSGQNKLGGVTQERYLRMFMSRRVLEEILAKMGMDIYEYPREEDICRLQGMYFEVTDIDPYNYHSNITYFPFDYNISIRPYSPTPVSPEDRVRVE